MNKKEILEAYKKFKKTLGRTPGYKEFILSSGVSQYSLAKHFRNYKNLLAQLGDTPPLTNNTYTDKDFIDAYGNFIRRYKKIPTYNDWIYYDIKPCVPAYSKRFKVKWTGIFNVFYEFIFDKPEWSDVLKIIDDNHWSLTKTRGKNVLLQRSYNNSNPGENIYRFIPPALNEFIDLAFASGPSVAFEGKCAVAMSILGYEVTSLGHGTGRNPDGIAKDLQNRYAVIYDAKARKEFYTLGTDDRAIIEYIRAQKNELHSKGFELIYFLIISSAFGSFSTYRIQSETGVVPSFITAENLLHIVSKKIECPRNYDTGRLKGLFVKGGEITKEEVKRIVN